MKKSKGVIRFYDNLRIKESSKAESLIHYRLVWLPKHTSWGSYLFRKIFNCLIFSIILKLNSPENYAHKI